MAGSARDLEDLVRRYEKKVYYTVLHITGDREEARDITQEAFLRMFKGLRGLKKVDSFPSWLLKIATNLALDHLRSSSQSVLEERDVEAIPQDHRGDVLQGLVTLEEREHLLDLLALLPPRQRMAVVLRVYNELPFKEVADIMGCQVATARSLFWAGVREMRRRLEREG